MSLNDAAKAAAVKKVTLLDESFARFAVRATLAGVYLCIGTAFAGVVGQAVNGVAPVRHSALGRRSGYRQHDVHGLCR